MCSWPHRGSCLFLWVTLGLFLSGLLASSVTATLAPTHPYPQPPPSFSGLLGGFMNW